MTILFRHRNKKLSISLFLCTFVIVIVTQAQSNPSSIQIPSAEVSLAEGWSCEDFPCEDDIEGFLQRIQVPAGFELSYVGQFDGQPMQIAYGHDGRLYATILEHGKRQGAVYAMNADGTNERVSPRFWSPVGLVFDPNSDAFYVSGRLNRDSNGAVWRVDADGNTIVLVDNLPCCYGIDNQPNGMIFGADGWLYLGIGSTSDHGESKHPESEAFSTPEPLEASIVRIHPQTGISEAYAEGIRNPYDIAQTSDGEIYVTDNGIATGQGDRLLKIEQGKTYGFPYWRARACEECPPRQGTEVEDDWLLLESYTLPRGITVYDGSQFPSNMRDTLFIAFWNGTEYSQRIVWINPRDTAIGSADYTPQAFVTSLIRPVDVVVAPDGSLVIADFIYGHIWRVSYTGTGNSAIAPLQATSDLSPLIATVIAPTANSIAAPATPTEGISNLVFATATPRQ